MGFKKYLHRFSSVEMTNSGVIWKKKCITLKENIINEKKFKKFKRNEFVKSILAYMYVYQTIERIV